MKPVEEIVGDKLIELGHYVLSKIVKPDITIDKVSELSETEIEKLKHEYGIEGIIIDVDETLRKEMRNIPKCNQEWVKKLNGQIKTIILSNGIDNKIEQYFKEQGVDYIGFALKPLKKNFIKACESMNVSPDKVLVVGDSLFDDIYGGKRNKMKTVLVKGVEEEER